MPWKCQGTIGDHVMQNGHLLTTTMYQSPTSSWWWRSIVPFCVGLLVWGGEPKVTREHPYFSGTPTMYWSGSIPIWNIGSRLQDRKCTNSPDGSMRVMMNKDAPSYHPWFSDLCVLSARDMTPSNGIWLKMYTQSRDCYPILARVTSKLILQLHL